MKILIIRPVPKYILSNLGLKRQREFKSLKRKQLREIIHAVGEYRTGCAACPEYGSDIQLLDQVLKRMKESHSAKEWGR